jgi:hypothetical protein
VLSKGPKMEEPMEDEEMEGAFDQADLDIASSSIVSMVLDPKGKEAFSKAVSSPEPVKALALVLSQFMEVAISGLESSGIKISPQVWLSPDGALAEASPVLIGLAEKMGIPLDEPTLDAVAAEVSKLLVQRGESMQQEQGAPPMAGPAPSPMGGQPNVMG